jgi:DNA-binding CsgD family transcriptional regulator
MKGFGFLPQVAEPVSTLMSIPRDRYYVDPKDNLYLTTRETQLSWHLLINCTVKESAESMRLSVRTVEFYLNNIKKRLEVYGKTSVISYLLNEGFFNAIHLAVLEDNGLMQCMKSYFLQYFAMDECIEMLNGALSLAHRRHILKDILLLCPLYDSDRYSVCDQ